MHYDWAHRLKEDFPALTIVVNGGITSTAQVLDQLGHVDGVMIGREAYHNPWWLSQWDAAFYRAGSIDLTRDQVEEQMVTYMERAAVEHGTPWPSIARDMLGLRRGVAGARHWRQVWSDHKLKELSPRQVMVQVQAHAPDCCAISRTS